MAQFVNMFEVDLQKPNHPQPLRAMVGEGDANGLRVGAYVTDGGAAVELGGSCVGKVVRADGATVQLTGTISGNQAFVILDQQSCAIEGPIQVAVCWVNNSNVTTLLLAYGTVVNTQTGTAIQPSTPIPDLTQLLAEISAMEQATAAAQAVTNSLTGAITESTWNLFDVNKITAFGSMENDNGVFKNTNTDSKTKFDAVLNFCNSSGTNQQTSSQISITSAGRYKIQTKVTASSIEKIKLKHNGSQRDLSMTFDCVCASGCQYTVSFDVLSANPSTVGGLQITNLQVEKWPVSSSYTNHLSAIDSYARRDISDIEPFLASISTGANLFSNAPAMMGKTWDGSVNGVIDFYNSTYRAAVGPISLVPGVKYQVKVNSGYRTTWRTLNANSVILADSGWQTASTTLTAEEGKFYCFIIGKVGDASATLEDLLNNVSLTATLSADINGALANFAGTFSTSTAYKTGDYVIYQGNLYRFISEHSAGAWNSAHVQIVTVGTELENINNAVKATLNDAGFTYGAWGTDGHVNSTSTYSLRSNGGIPLKKGDIIKTSNASVDYRVIYLSNGSTSYTDGTWSTYGTAFTAPNDGLAKVVTRKHSQESIAEGEKEGIAKAVLIITRIFEQVGFENVSDNTEAIAYGINGYTHFNVADFEHGGLMSGNGGIDSSNHKRAVMTNITTLQRAMTVIAKTGYKFAVAYFNDSDTFLAYSGWQTKFFIPSGANIRIGVAADSDSTVGDLDGIPEILVDNILYSTDMAEKLPDNLKGELTQATLGFEYGYTYYYQNSALVINYPATACSMRYPVFIPKGTVIFCDEGYRFKLYAYDLNYNLTEHTNDWHTGDSKYQYTAANDCRILISAESTAFTPLAPDVIASHMRIQTNVSNALLPRVSRIENALGMSDVYAYDTIGTPVNTRPQKYNVRKIIGLESTALSDITVGSVTSFQGMAIYGGVIFQLYSDNVIELLDMATQTVIADLSITSEHGNSISFSNEFYASDDEFPLAYVSSDSNPAKVYVNRITRTGTTLIRTYDIPQAQSGYYADHALDNLNRILYTVGYTNNSYSTDDGTNFMIVCAWDLKTVTDDGNNTYTPTFIKSFKLPFMNTRQGQKFFNGQIAVLASKQATPNENTVYFVDIGAERITTVINALPSSIRSSELEDIDFVNENGKYYMVIKPNTTSFFRVDFD